MHTYITVTHGAQRYDAPARCRFGSSKREPCTADADAGMYIHVCLCIRMYFWYLNALFVCMCCPMSICNMHVCIYTCTYIPCPHILLYLYDLDLCCTYVFFCVYTRDTYGKIDEHVKVCTGYFSALHMRCCLHCYVFICVCYYTCMRIYV